MRTTTLEVTDIEAARTGSEDLWTAGNAVLYRLCAEFPRHDTERDTIAKLWLIGRAYTAAIERRPTSQEPEKVSINEYYRRAAKALEESDLDDHLANLRSGRPNALCELTPALRAHAVVVSKLHALSRTHQRSFASKYLHFHAPDWYFILDSIATKGLQRLGVQVTDDQSLADVGDPTYRKFVLQAWALRSKLESVSAPALTPRQLDRYLLTMGEADGCSTMGLTIQSSVQALSRREP